MAKELPINQIICGDCVEVMKSWPDECIDLTVTSPPYDNLRDYKGYTFDFETIAKELYRVTKPGGVVVWVVSDATINGSETGTSFRQALYFKDVCGFNLHDTMIYKKKASRFPETNRYYQVFEYMFVFSKGRPKTVNLIRDRRNLGFGNAICEHARQKDGTLKKRKGKIISKLGVRFNIWEYSTGGSISAQDEIAFQHPAIFPEQLAADHIISWSNPGDIVLDPMCGSGTTCKMALKLGRRFIGIDIAEEYCEIARKRVDAERERQKFQIIPSSELT
jgi:DNA modification methylase